MRRVVSPEDVAHKFAHQLQDEARTPAGNMYFKGNIIYSYGNHFPIAKFVEFENKKVLLFTLDSYSKTTAKHISIVRQACSHIEKLYVESPKFSHNENFRSWEQKAYTITQAFQRAKKPEIYIRKLQEISNYVHKYAEFYNATIPDELIQLLNISSSSESVEYFKEINKKIEEDRIKNQLKRYKDSKAELKKWRTFELDKCWKQFGDGVYLRIIAYQNTAFVETSKDIKIPKDVALRFYNSFIDNKLKVGSKFMDFKIDEVSTQHIKIGCHNITAKEMYNCYKQLILTK